MKQLKCDSCGANLEVNDNEEYAKCPYCKAEYKLKDDKNINININDNSKEAINNGIDSAKKVTIVFFIIFGVVAVLVFSGVAFFITTIINQVDKNTKDNDKTINSIFEKAKKEIEDEEDDEKDSKFEIDRFNNSLEMYSGTQTKFLLSSLLDKVVTNNKKNSDKYITVIYNDKQTTKPDEIIAIKNSLNDDYSVKYEVILDYSDKGYVNTVTIKDL